MSGGNQLLEQGALQCPLQKSLAPAASTPPTWLWGPEGPKEVDLGVQWHKGPALAVGVGWPLSPGPGPNIALSCGARGAGAGGG